jgi:hypothetical protein
MGDVDFTKAGAGTDWITSDTTLVGWDYFVQQRQQEKKDGWLLLFEEADCSIWWWRLWVQL